MSDYKVSGAKTFYQSETIQKGKTESTKNYLHVTVSLSNDKGEQVKELTHKILAKDVTGQKETKTEKMLNFLMGRVRLTVGNETYLVKVRNLSNQFGLTRKAVEANKQGAKIFEKPMGDEIKMQHALETLLHESRDPNSKLKYKGENTGIRANALVGSRLGPLVAEKFDQACIQKFNAEIVTLHNLHTEHMNNTKQWLKKEVVKIKNDPKQDNPEFKKQDIENKKLEYNEYKKLLNEQLKEGLEKKGAVLGFTKKEALDLYKGWLTQQNSEHLGF